MICERDDELETWTQWLGLNHVEPLPTFSRCYNMQMHWSSCGRTLGMQRTQIGQTATLGHVILHQFVQSIFSMRHLRRHNIADFEAALVCIALRIGQ